MSRIHERYNSHYPSLIIPIGKHYWEATTLSCSYQGSYIGVALESLSEGYYLGSCPGRIMIKRHLTGF